MFACHFTLSLSLSLSPYSNSSGINAVLCILTDTHLHVEMYTINSLYIRVPFVVVLR